MVTDDPRDWLKFPFNGHLSINKLAVTALTPTLIATIVLENAIKVSGTSKLISLHSSTIVSENICVIHGMPSEFHISIDTSQSQ